MNDLELQLQRLPWSVPRRINTKGGMRIVSSVRGVPEIAEIVKAHQAALGGLGISVSSFRGELQLSKWRALTAEEVEEINDTIRASCAKDAAIDIPSPEGLTYLPFQRAGIAFALGRPNTLIADEMGLGKTIQAIGFVNALHEAKRILVITKASLRINWRKELNKWLVREFTIGIARKGTFPDDGVVIVSYNAVARFRRQIDEVDWDVIIADEGHALKNPDAARSRAVLGWRPTRMQARKIVEPALGTKLSDEEIDLRIPALTIQPIQARRKLILTGTPIDNRPKEAFPLLHYLAPEEFRSFFSYAARYCDAKLKEIGRGRRVWDRKGSSNHEELQQRLRSTIMVRRLKSEVMSELPPKRRAIIELPADGFDDVLDESRSAYERYQAIRDQIAQLKELAEKHPDSTSFAARLCKLEETRAFSFAEMSKARHRTALAKLPLAIEHLKDCTDDDPEHKIVVFAHHRDVLDRLVAEFGNRGVHVFGGMSDTAKDAAVEAFQENPRIQFFFGQIEAAGVGLTLTAASHVVMVEDHWVPGMVTQAEDRCHRYGQHDNVYVEHLVLEGSIDVKVIEDLIAKQETITRVLDTPSLLPVPTPALQSSTQEAQVPQLGEQIVRAVHAALKIIAGMCDGAKRPDSQGFSGVDAYIGKSLAASPGLSAKQALLGLKICRKYHRQIPAELYSAIYSSEADTGGHRTTAGSAHPGITGMQAELKLTA